MCIITIPQCNYNSLICFTQAKVIVIILPLLTWFGTAISLVPHEDYSFNLMVRLLEHFCDILSLYASQYSVNAYIYLSHLSHPK